MLGCHAESPSTMNAKSGNSLATVLVAAAIVAALYFGREVLLPMALAVLLSFVLAPPVKLLQRLHLPRFAAVTIVVLLAFGVIFGLATLMFAQVSQLAGDLPRYQSNLGEKIQALRGAATASGTLEQASQVLRNCRKNSIGQKAQNPLLLQRRTRAPSRIGPFRLKCGNRIQARFKHSPH